MATRKRPRSTRHQSNNYLPMLKAIRFPKIAILANFAFVVSSFADVGGDNPAGTSGQYNGNVTTGCSYDPYTANATRSITDLVVAGGVGSYPLAFTRTMNSRYTTGANGNAPAFGTAGTWTFSYQWTIDSVTTVGAGGVAYPATYNVNYPDGRRVNFRDRPSTGDPVFRGQSGIRDRLKPLNANVPDNVFLKLADGGRVQFRVDTTTTKNGSGQNKKYTSVFKFTVAAVIDPYGQRTTINYPAPSTMVIREPAGRTITIYFRNPGSSEGNPADIVVDYVLSSDGRRVDYHYSPFVTANGSRYTSLTSVVYYSDPTWTALYTYQPSNVDPNGRPLIKTCVDPMYDGPMWKIGYMFAPNASGVVYGQLKSENYFNGTTIGARYQP